jgi:hypothetical protein
LTWRVEIEPEPDGRYADLGPVLIVTRNDARTMFDLAQYLDSEDKIGAMTVTDSPRMVIAAVGADVEGCRVESDDETVEDLTPYEATVGERFLRLVIAPLDDGAARLATGGVTRDLRCDGFPSNTATRTTSGRWIIDL